MRRAGSRLLLILLLLTLLAPICAGAAAGSAADPLVSKSWVDSFVERQFAPLENELKALRQQLKGDAIDITLNINSTAALVNGENRVLDAAPTIIGSGYTMVPVRFVAEALGIQVDWLPETRQVIFQDANTVLQLTIGSTEAMINGQPYTMAVAPLIDNSLSQGRTLVHIRFVGEAFGCQLDWQPKDGRTEQVFIRR